MILIDPKGPGKKGQPYQVPHEMKAIFQRLHLDAEVEPLEFGDVAFEGRGPEGPVLVGIERKTLHDMLNCIDDASYTGHQRVGMKQMYAVSILLLEGHWKPHDPAGILMEGYNGGITWGYCQNRNHRTMYSKLYRYLISVALSGVIVTYSRDLFHTCYNIHEWYHYFQKRWDGHTSLLEQRKLNIPTLNGRPKLVRRWAHELSGVGVKIGDLAARHFQKPYRLALADESEWLKIPGVGVKTAQDIVREIMG